MSSFWSNFFKGKGGSEGDSDSGPGDDDGTGNSRWGSLVANCPGASTNDDGASNSRRSSTRSICSESRSKSPGHDDHEMSRSDSDEKVEVQRDELHSIYQQLNIEKEEIRHHRDVMNPTLVVRNDGYSIPFFAPFFANCAPACPPLVEASWEPQPLFFEESKAEESEPAPAATPASAPAPLRNESRCDCAFEPPPLAIDDCPPEDHSSEDCCECECEEDPSAWDGCEIPAPEWPGPEDCPEPVLDEVEETILEDVTEVEDLGADDYCSEEETAPTCDCGCCDEERTPAPPVRTLRFQCTPIIEGASKDGPVNESASTQTEASPASCWDRARKPTLADICPEYYAKKKAEEATRVVAEVPKPAAPVECVKPSTPVQEECPEPPPTEECPPEEVKTFSCDCENIPKLADICSPPPPEPDCEPEPEPDCEPEPEPEPDCEPEPEPMPEVATEPEQPDTCQCECSPPPPSVTTDCAPPPSALPLCPDLPKDVQDIVSKASQLSPSVPDSCCPPPPRRVICYICDYGDSSQDPCAPKPEDKCGAPPPEVSSADADVCTCGSEPEKAPVDECEEPTTVPDEEPCPEEPEEVCDCSCEEPAEPEPEECEPEPEPEPEPEEPDCEPEPEPEPECPPEPEPEPEPEDPCPPEPEPEPCPPPPEAPPACPPPKASACESSGSYWWWPSSSQTTKAEECVEVSQEPQLPSAATFEERITQLRDRNSTYMNDFCGCRKCTQSGGCCSPSAPGPYKCSCPDCGDVRGENPECRMCNFATCMDQEKARMCAMAAPQPECDCPDCVRDRCNSTTFDLNHDGSLKYEGGMCLQRAQAYMWKSTETEEPNSYRLLSFEDQNFEGFSNCTVDCCTCQCTCGECEGEGCEEGVDGESGQCNGVGRKYRGGMTLQEVQDWSWCHK